MLRGKAEILASGTEHRDAQNLLRSRYPQLQAMQISQLPVIALRISRVSNWATSTTSDEPDLHGPLSAETVHFLPDVRCKWIGSRQTYTLGHGMTG